MSFSVMVSKGIGCESLCCFCKGINGGLDVRFVFFGKGINMGFDIRVYVFFCAGYSAHKTDKVLTQDIIEVAVEHTP